MDFRTKQTHSKMRQETHCKNSNTILIIIFTFGYLLEAHRMTCLSKSGPLSFILNQVLDSVNVLSQASHS